MIREIEVALFVTRGFKKRVGSGRSRLRRRPIRLKDTIPFTKEMASKTRYLAYPFEYSDGIVMRHSRFLTSTINIQQQEVMTDSLRGGKQSII